MPLRVLRLPKSIKYSTVGLGKTSSRCTVLRFPCTDHSAACTGPLLALILYGLDQTDPELDFPLAGNLDLLLIPLKLATRTLIARVFCPFATRTLYRSPVLFLLFVLI